jgi:hypothetical protein
MSITKTSGAPPWWRQITRPQWAALVDTSLGWDYQYPAATASRLSTFKNEMRGSGPPCLHDDPIDRPAEVFAGTSTIYIGQRIPRTCCCRSSLRSSS